MLPELKRSGSVCWGPTACLWHNQANGEAMTGWGASEPEH